jgi:hypothetical protein
MPELSADRLEHQDLANQIGDWMMACMTCQLLRQAVEPV